MKKITTLFAALVLVIVSFGFVPAFASDGSDEPCVPQDAWTETIEHPAVTHEETITVVDEEAWTETVVDEEAHWQRYSWTGGPHESDDAPAFPSDDWQPNVKGDPHGVGVEGAYWRSNGNSGKGDWFYLDWVEAVTHTVEHPAITHEETIVVVDEKAWTENIDHPAVTCDDEPPVDECLDPVTGEDLCVHEEPEPPVDNNPETPVGSGTPNDEPKGTPTSESYCLADALVTKSYDAEGNTLSTSTESGSPKCAPKDGEVFKEEGM